MSTTAPVDETEETDSNTIIGIVAGVCGTILALALVVLIVCIVRNRKDSLRNSQNNSSQNNTSQTRNATYANPVLQNSSEPDRVNTGFVNDRPARVIPGSTIDPDEHVYQVDVCIQDEGHKYDIAQKEVVLTDVSGVFKIPKVKENKRNNQTGENSNDQSGNTDEEIIDRNNGHINPAFRSSVDTDNEEVTISNNPS